MNLLQNLICFLVGICAGSFVNMLVFRTAINYGLVKNKERLRSDFGGRSYCDWCGKQLSWYENVPVLSWLILQGKSRCCGKKLPLLYPVVELGLGILFVIWGQIGLGHIPTLVAATGFFLLVFMVFSAVFDLKYMILPDFSTIVLVFLALLMILFGGQINQFFWFAVAAAVGFGFIWFLFWITKGQGMGFGDVKFAGFMGIFLGLSGIVIAMYVAFITGAVLGLGLMLFSGAGRKTKMPFGPFLILGTLVAWWYAKLK